MVKKQQGKRVKKKARQIVRYDPKQDAADRWPSWQFIPTKLHGVEKIISPDAKVVLFEETLDHATEIAQAVSHLDLGHHVNYANRSQLPDSAHEDAMWMAEMRIDGERSWGYENQAVKDESEE